MRGRRERKYLEKLQKLMGEWGFKDLATAEAYYKRTQHQKRGATRKKLEAKMADPANRLKRLQEHLEHARRISVCPATR